MRISRVCTIVLSVTFNLSTISFARDAGAELFKSKCADCHGADGRGRTSTDQSLGLLDLASSEVQSQSDAVLNRIITRGNRKMPAFESKLTKDEIDELVRFVRSLAPLSRDTSTARDTSIAATGVVSGKIFFITRGGDLKPARLAMVFLLDAHAGENARDSASLFYYNTKLANMKASFRQLADPDDNISCQTSLLVFGNSLKSTLEWNERERKDLIKIGETDEEGAFRFPGVPPGEYLILAQGHAGANRAYWEGEATAETGKEVSIKLSSPKNACLE
jgi:cytochrome c6